MIPKVWVLTVDNQDIERYTSTKPYANLHLHELDNLKDVNIFKSL